MVCIADTHPPGPFSISSQGLLETEGNAASPSAAASAGGASGASSSRTRPTSNDPFELPDYKPNINLVYKDEFGRDVGPKEQFKLMSHVFHGKAPGKNKRDKRLQKYKEEMRLKSMSAVDTPLRMMEAVRKQQEKSGAAHVVLSGSFKE